MRARFDGQSAVPPSLERLDLSPLYARCLLRSDVRRETYDCIAAALCDYELVWRGGGVDARAYTAGTGRISIYEIQYGDEVSITPSLYREFVLAHVSLQNGIEVEADGTVTHVPEGAIFFSAPQVYVKLRWQAHCRQLLVRIPANILFHEPTGAQKTPRPGRLLPPSLLPVFIDQLNLALSIAGQTRELDNYGHWVSHVELLLARFAALQLFDRTPRPGAEATTKQVAPDWPERLEGFIQARLKSPLMLDDLTRAVGVGRSQLNTVCHQVFECSPMELVRRMRLTAARADLERRPNQELTTLALRYGFEHQSRFAQYYRDRFHELPRDTRRRLVG